MIHLPRTNLISFPKDAKSPAGSAGLPAGKVLYTAEEMISPAVVFDLSAAKLISPAGEIGNAAGDFKFTAGFFASHHQDSRRVDRNHREEAMKDFRSKKDSDLRQDVAGTLAALQGRFEEFGLTESDLEILRQANDQFGADIQKALVMESKKRSAVAQKNESRADVVFAINTVAKKIYADPSVDNEMLVSIGLAVRPNYSTRTHPVAPTALVALPQGDGGVVTLRWDRNGNSEHAIFTIWAIGYDENWRIVGSTKSTKIQLDGFTPGVPQTFRVTASVNGRTSGYSNTGAIYSGLFFHKAA